MEVFKSGTIPVEADMTGWEIQTGKWEIAKGNRF